MVKTMQYATHVFTAEEKRVIEAAIAQAEQGTSAEIVPVVATVSGRYDRAEDLFAFILTLAVLACLWPWLGDGSAEGWSGVGIGLPGLVIILVLTFIAGAVLASRIPVLRLPFIHKREMQEEVERSALAAFQRCQVGRTAQATGVLIYVSLYERMVHVVGDDTISAVVPQAQWQTLCETILNRFRAGQYAAGMTDGIMQCGALLADRFPMEPGDMNEIANTLHLIDD